MKKFITFIIACCVCGCMSLFAQNIQEILLNATTNGDTIEAPGAGTYIFDDGGNGGSYTGGHDYHLVIKSTCDTLDTVNHMCIIFTFFDIACTDTLYIYDGKSTSAPLLLKRNNCYASSPSNRFFISKTNTTGMLTLRLRTTPGSEKPAGFALRVECDKPCENVTAHIANYYERTDRYGNIIQRDYLKLLPETFDTVWYYTPDSVRTDSVIRVDTISWVDGALICDGQGIIFHGYGEYTHLTGYYNPHDTSTMFYWTFGTEDTLVQRNAIAPLYTKYKDVGCYDVLLSMIDVNGCATTVSPHIQVRLAKNPIKTIFDLAPICNNEFLTVNVGYDGQGTLTLKKNKFVKVRSKTNNVRTFIPDGPRCDVRCYEAPVEFKEFPSGKSVTSAGDICSVCVNYEHSYMGDYSMALLCPTYNSAVSQTRGRAVLKYKDASQAPGGSGSIPPGTYGGGGTFTGMPWGGNSFLNGDNINGGGNCDSLHNLYGIGYNYCFSRNGDYTLISGEAADASNPQAAGLASSNHTVSASIPCPPIPAGFASPSNLPAMFSHIIKDSSDHDNKRDYFIPADDFSTLVGCPLNGEWKIELCDYLGRDNGWVFSWSLDICGISAGGGCEYQVGVDSVVWRPDTNYATDFRDGRYVGLQIHPTDSVNSNITSPDTAGDFTIILSVYDEFGCRWDTVTHITSVYTPRPELGPDTLLCGVASMELNASDRFAKHANYRYTWAPFGETDSIINTHTNTNADITYVVEVDNYQSNKHCVSRDTVHVAVNDQPIANFDPGAYPLEGCEPLTLRIDNTSKYGYKFRWVFGDGTISTQKNPTHSYAAGQYDFKYYVESEKGCKDSLIYNKLVTVYPNPQASFSWDPVYPTVMHPSIQLENRTTPDDGTNKYFWEVQYNRDNPYSFDTRVEKDPVYEWTANNGEDVSGSYTVRLIARTDNRGPSGRLVQCADTVENTILLINDFLQFPSVVTPNGDGINDRFVINNLIEGLGYPINELDIYDKWGSRVFHATNITRDDQFWDPAASNTPTGTYFYRFSGKGYNGSVERNGVFEILR